MFNQSIGEGVVGEKGGAIQYYGQTLTRDEWEAFKKQYGPGSRHPCHCDRSLYCPWCCCEQFGRWLENYRHNLRKSNR